MDMASDDHCSLSKALRQRFSVTQPRLLPSFCHGIHDSHRQEGLRAVPWSRLQVLVGQQYVFGQLRPPEPVKLATKQVLEPPTEPPGVTLHGQRCRAIQFLEVQGHPKAGRQQAIGPLRQMSPSTTISERLFLRTRTRLPVPGPGLSTN